MKQLTLQSETYRYIIAAFKEWLQTIGYSEQTVYQLPNYIQEFLFYAEGKGYAGLFQITNDLMKEHYYKLKERGNKRRTGGLSNSYLNKHLQALQKFGDYLRLKQNNLRQVQYMAGHKYVSSTERYQCNNLDDLQNELQLHHPMK